jgi:hypothetical protein
VPRHTRVLQKGVMDAAKFGITAFLLMFYYKRFEQIVIFNQLGVPQNLFNDLKGAANQKKVEEQCLRLNKFQNVSRSWFVQIVDIRYLTFVFLLCYLYLNIFKHFRTIEDFIHANKDQKLSF